MLDDDKYALGHVPRVTEDELERDKAEIEARVRDLQAMDDESIIDKLRVLEVLLRNRRNLLELLRSGRFT